MANEFKVKKGLIVHGSGSTVLDIQGSQGQLFSITDDLTGTLFAVSDISGVPIFDVNADGTSTLDGNIVQTSGSATFGNGIILQQTAGNSLIESSTSSMFIKASNIQTQGNLIPDADSSRNLGATNRYWENLYADNLYGDGSNLTNVTASSFTETDTLDSVTGRGATTTNDITIGNIEVNSSITTPTDTSLKLYPNGSGHLYLGDAGNGMNMYHYSQQDNGKYTTFTHNGTYYRISPTATSGLEITSNTKVSGDLTVTGKVTAQEFHTEFVSASIMYESGSTKFGDTSDDTHKFTGSLYIDEGDIHLDSGRYIKFYGNTSNNHSIGSVDANGTNSDDIRINSYHNVFVDLDSNNNNTDTTTFFQISQHSAASTLNTPFFKVRGDGRVGINEDSPDSVLHINTGTGTGNANTVIIDRAGSSDYSGLSFATAGTIDWSIGQNSAGNFELFEDGQDAKTRMTVKVGGNVGIGATSPADKLHIQGGNLRLENGATSITQLIPGGGGNSTLTVKGGNYYHNVYFDTSWNDFRYARLSSSYNTSDSSFYLYKSDASGGTSATTTISTGTSTFAGNVTTSGNSLHISSRKFIARDSNGTGLFADDASSGLSIADNGNATFTGDVVVAGKVTAQEFHTEFVSASIMYESGSTKFGDTSDDLHSFTGSININGGTYFQSYDNGGDIWEVVDGDVGIRTKIESDGLGNDNSFWQKGGSNTSYSHVIGYEFGDTTRLLIGADNCDEIYIGAGGSGSAILSNGGLAVIASSATSPPNTSKISLGGNSIDNATTTGVTFQYSGSKFNIVENNSTEPIFEYDSTGNEIVVKIGDFPGLVNETYIEINDTDEKVIIPNGNVGIGTENPNALLHVGSDYTIPSGYTGINTVLNGGVFINIFEESTKVFGIWSDPNGAAILQIDTDPTNLFLIDPTGDNEIKVGIGNTNPDEKLEVTGNIKLDAGAIILSGSPAGQGAQVRYLSGASTTNDYWFNVPDNGRFRFAVADSQKVEFTSAGNVLATSFKVDGETDATKFLKGDGTLDASTYLTSANLNGYLLNTTDNFTGTLNILGGNNNSKESFINVKRGDASGEWLKFQTDSTTSNNVSQFVIRKNSDSTDLISINTSTNATTFAGNVDSQGFHIDAASLQSFQDFQSKPIDTDSGLFTVGGHGMALGYSRAVSMWSSTDGVWNSWVGTNLRWDGTNFKRASDNGGQNWGNIAGIRFLGNSGTSGAAMQFIIDPPEQSNVPSGEQTIGTSLPSSMTALSLNNDLSATFAGTIGSGAITSTGKITGTELEGTSLDINGAATFDTNVNSGGFIDHKNSNAGSAAYTSLRIQSDVGGAEIWRNSSTRTQTGGAAQSFNIYNNQDTNIWSGGTRALHLNTSQNAIFAGTVTSATAFIADAVSGNNNDPGSDNLQVSGYGIIGNRANLYITNANTDSSAIVQIGVGGVHNNAPRLVIGTGNSTFYTNILPSSDSAFNIGSSSARFSIGFFDSLRITNVVTNKILKFDGTDIDDSIMSDDGSTVSLAGDLTVTGKVTAQEFHTEFVSASIMYESGSTKFGDSSDDVHNFTGSVNIDGTLSATVKSFDIAHPTQEGKRLVYGVLEGPEHAVYVRGESKEDTVILPEEWKGLVDKDTLTVQLTPISSPDIYYYKNYENNSIIVGGPEKKHYFYYVQATRKDVEPLITVQ